MLNRHSAQAITDSLQKCCALATLGVRSDFDELMAVEVEIDLAQHGVGEPVVANQHHWT
jgi:hypothetical protein